MDRLGLGRGLELHPRPCVLGQAGRGPSEVDCSNGHTQIPEMENMSSPSPGVGKRRKAPWVEGSQGEAWPPAPRGLASVSHAIPNAVLLRF